MSVAVEPAREASERPPVTVLDLFLAFGRVGITGFGGVLPWARRMLVEERRWLTEEEFVNLLSLAQFLPGGNVMNLSVCVGARFGGALGAVAALSGLMLMPVVIVLCLATLYARFSNVPTVEAMFHGLSSGAAGLVVATGLKMLLSLRRNPRALAFVALTIVAMAFLKLPLLLIVVTLLPLSLAALVLWRP